MKNWAVQAVIPCKKYLQREKIEELNRERRIIAKARKWKKDGGTISVNRRLDLHFLKVRGPDKQG